MKSILVTGGAGFIGSNFVPYFVNKYPDYKIVTLDALTYAGELRHIAEVQDSGRHVFVHGDICDRSLVEQIFASHDIRGVVHFAAESHVDNSIAGPEVFVRTNVMGTFTLIDVARKHWMQAPGQYRDGYADCRFHHVSTDEVYGTLSSDPAELFREDTPYAPNSPYSASKAGSDLLVRSYHHTYGMNVVTTNCSNNYGPKQHKEKLIPTILRKCLAEQNIPVYGDGKNVRDWLYVLDHCTGIDLAYHTGRSGETYNIGGRNERENIYIVKTICAILDQKVPRTGGAKYEELISYVQDRAGHDRRYAIDATKLENELGWRAAENFESGILKTVEWYLDNRWTLESL